jgi:hypothetical protein
MNAPPHLLNWDAGWLLVLAGFATGALIGLGFHHEHFLGGYTSFRRRMLRLGHIALAALGLLNVLFALSPWPEPGSQAAAAASIAFVIGGVTMPAACFLTAWRERFRHVFALPVTALFVGVICTWLGGHS